MRKEAAMIRLKYSATNTFFVPGDRGGLLIDTGYAGSMQAFFKAIKAQGIRMSDIRFVMATHYTFPTAFSPGTVSPVTSPLTRGGLLL